MSAVYIKGAKIENEQLMVSNVTSSASTCADNVSQV
jgi:hypothetical protein